MNKKRPKRSWFLVEYLAGGR